MLLTPIAHALTLTALLAVAPAGAPPVQTNDNQVPAGRLAGGVRTIQLRAAVGTWRPEGGAGRAIMIEAFGEGSGALSIPAPLIRVAEGTVISATIRNELSHALRLHGLCERGLQGCAPIEIPPGETRTTRFASGPAGTYHYWATTTGMPQQFRGADDSQLSGALVVDPAGAEPLDRVFVITEWTSLTRAQLREIAAKDDPGAAFLALRPDVFFAINGRIWPHTERLRYAVSTPVRWRVINLSTQVHPMHLHGFYFGVDSLGNGLTDRPFEPERRPRVVTQVLPPGSTMTMTWEPERPGNWLFHCHVMTHVSPTLHVDGSSKAGATTHSDHLPGAGMTGMVLGVTIEGPEPEEEWSESKPDKRTLTLEMRTDPRRFGDEPAYGFTLATEQGATPAAVPVPGPTLVLTRGQPVEITLVNRLPEGTAIHWHGMELDSYYDGVHGWSGTATRVTPMIAPGGSFVVRFTPPRAGTFMYHTHLHDRRQLTSGLYGAMLVVEPGETFDEGTDHVVVLGRGGPDLRSPVVINERNDPVFAWKAGTRHRVRLINITPDDILAVSMQTSGGPVVWQPLTKDGAPLPPDGRAARDARQVIGVGETYDFEFQAPPGRQNLWLEVRSTGGRWLAQAQVIVR